MKRKERKTALFKKSTFRKCIIGGFLLMSLGGISYAQSDSTRADTLNVGGRTFGVSAGLGVSLVHAADIVDYITTRYGPEPKLNDFATAAEFFGTAELQLSESWGAKVEYAYLLKSYDDAIAQSPGLRFTYVVHMPTALVQYLIQGRGYVFKFGGGLGYHVATFTEDYALYGGTSYSSRGIGLKLEAEGNTEFDSHLYAYIVGDIRGDMMSEFKSTQGTPLINPVNDKHASMSFYSVGLKFGLMYYF
jgi:hypothetical protein